MKGILLLFVLALPCVAGAQNSFLKVYPNGNDADAFKDLAPLSPNEYAFITATFFYRIDGQGKVLLKKDLKEGESTFLESLLPDGAGNCYISGQVFYTEAPTLRLYKVSNTGQVLSARTVATTGTISDTRLAHGRNNILYLCWLHRPTPDDTHLDVAAFDGQGQELWRREFNRDLHLQHAVRPTQDGKLDVLYASEGGEKTWLTQVDANGMLKERAIGISQPVNTLLATSAFCPTADGGYVFAGSITNGQRLRDGLLYKTDQDGHVQWQQKIDVKRGDQFTDILAVADGYVVTANTDYDGAWGGSVAGDVALLKTNLQGQVQWTRAFGSSRTDYVRCIRMPDANSIVFGGNAKVPGYVASIPFVCRTDEQGYITTSLPFQLVSPTIFRRLQTNDPSPVQQLVKAVPAPDGGTIAAAHVQSTTDDLVYAHLLKADASGQVQWQKALSDRPATVRALTTTRDGHYAVLIEQKGFLGMQAYTLLKCTPAGDTLWTASHGASVLRDVIATSDGGYLLVGSYDETLSNHDLLLIRTDAKGQTVWKKKAGINSLWEFGRSVKETPEQDFIIAGNAQTAFDGASQAYAARVNKDGVFLWEKTLTNGLNDHLLFDVALASNGDYIMAGSGGPAYKADRDIIVMRVNKQGNKVWEKTFDLHLLDEGFSLLCTTGDTILVAGTTGEAPAGKLEKFGYLMKLDGQGNKQSVQYFGKESVQSTIEKIMLTGSGDVLLAGNTQEAYGKEYMYLTKAGAAAPAEEPGEAALTIYPNPTATKVFLSMKNNYNGPVNIVLYNTTGQQVMVLERNKTSFEMKEEMPLSNLSSGMYYFFIQHGTERSLKRLEVINRP